jgi:outer membrane biosynthesis protein TonB
MACTTECLIPVKLPFGDVVEEKVVNVEEKVEEPTKVEKTEEVTTTEEVEEVEEVEEEEEVEEVEEVATPKTEPQEVAEEEEQSTQPVEEPKDREEKNEPVDRADVDRPNGPIAALVSLLADEDVDTTHFEFDADSYKKAIIVTGDNTKQYREVLARLGGKWNTKLHAWCFSKRKINRRIRHRDEIMSQQSSQAEDIEAAQDEE